ncbi:MAG: phosphate acyltransferase PlsX [Oscillospiraceae bacterium]|nr:phosphate acyltransferase PlsX [Oscillospiraceae bacterium]
MKIIVDAFGGDNAPLEVLKGAERAVRELDVEIMLTGNKNVIEKCAEDNNISLQKMEIIHTEEVFDIHEEPSKIVKTGKNTSLALGLQYLRDGKGDAFLSAGSTGALVVGATMIAKRIKGVKRVALAPIMPSEKGYFMLIDAGANTECRPEMLLQFAVMGSAYMQTVMGLKSPRTALANIGGEETKGRELEIETYKLLKESSLNFTGNIEARDIPKGDADVVVADGYTGNMLLKLYEGMGKFMSNKLKMLFSGFSGKLSGMLILNKINLLKKQMDYKEVGGAVLLGVSRPVIKAHGSSDANAFFNAIRQAKKCVDGDVVGKITDYISESNK